MKKLKNAILGDGPWEFESRMGRAFIYAGIAVGAIAWASVLFWLWDVGRSVLG